MKTNIFILMIALFVGIGFSACTKDPTDNPQIEPPVVYEEGYFSFHFSNPVDTRAPVGTDEERGSDDENKIERVWVLLYDTDGTLKYAFDLNASNVTTDQLGNFSGNDVVEADATNGIPAPDAYQFRMKAKKVQKQAYKMVVIANPGNFADRITQFTTESQDVKTDDPFSRLDKFVNESGSAVNGGYLNGNGEKNEFFTAETFWKFTESDGDKEEKKSLFFMSNANGIIQVPEDAVKTTTLDAHKAPVFVRIDRALAKVIVNEIPTGTVVDNGGKITSFQWTLIIVNRKEFLVRHLTNLGTDNSQDFYTGELETGSHTDRKWKYAEDPNFGSTSYNDFYDDSDFLDVNRANGGVVNETNSKYATENTMDFGMQRTESSPTRSEWDFRKVWQNYTTQVRINVWIEYPESVFGNVVDEVDPEDYYSYKYDEADVYVRKVFTHAQAVQWLSSGSFPEDMPGLQNALNSWELFNTAAKPDVETWVSDGTITFHKAGFNEYLIPIKHFHPGGSYINTRYGHHGVVRNNIYRVVISKFEGPGVPATEGEWLSADITVNPWYKRSQIEDLSHE